MTRLTFRPGNHAYYLAGEDGKKQRVSSVTTLQNQLAKPQLVAWAARLSAEYAVDNWETLTALDPAERRDEIKAAHERSRNTAAARGTTIHALAEDLLAGRPVDCPETLLPQVEGMARFWETAGWEQLHAENLVWSPADEDLGLCAYAGQFDLIVRDTLEGTVGLVDLKTGSRVYPETATQVEAYRTAAFMVDADADVDMPDVDWTGVLHVQPTETVLHVVTPEAARAAREQFSLLRMMKAAEKPWLEEAVR